MGAMTNEKECGKIKELLKHIQENPDLPIVPMVDGEIVGSDEYRRWLGGWGSSRIDEYLVGEERLYFREDDDSDEIDATLTDRGIFSGDCEDMSDEEIKAAYAALPWTKAIIVNIDLPD